LPFYAINKEKHCDRIIIGDNGHYIVGNEQQIFYNNGDYDYTAVVIDCCTNDVSCFCVVPFQFNFNLYWSDNVGHGGKHYNPGEIDYKTPIPELSNSEQGNVYPFEVRITPVVNQSVI
jgi:phage-related protein